MSLKRGYDLSNASGKDGYEIPLERSPITLIEGFNVRINNPEIMHIEVVGETSKGLRGVHLETLMN